MNAKENIIARLSIAGIPETPMPQIAAREAADTDLVRHFTAMLAAAGGSVVEKEPEKTIADVIGTITGDTSGEWAFTVAEGRFGVAENGAVWITDIYGRSRLFASEHLVLTLPRTAIVATMGDAFADPRFGFGEFGCFVAGPSKTADIEQSLVTGAHGAIRVTVLLI